MRINSEGSNSKLVYTQNEKQSNEDSNSYNYKLQFRIRYEHQARLEKKKKSQTSPKEKVKLDRKIKFRPRIKETYMNNNQRFGLPRSNSNSCVTHSLANGNFLFVCLFLIQKDLKRKRAKRITNYITFSVKGVLVN